MSAKDELDAKYKIKIEKILSNNSKLNGFYEYVSDTAISTAYNYLLHVDSFLEYLGNKDLHEVGVDDFGGYLKTVEVNQKGEETSSSYKIAVYSALKKYGIYLVEIGILNNNPMDEIKRPKPEKLKKEKLGKEKEYLSNEEIKQLLFAIEEGVGSQRSKNRQVEWKERDLAVVTLFLATGMKTSELIQLDVNDIDFSNKVLFCNNNVKEYKLSEQTLEVLKRWVDKRKVILNNNLENALFISNRKTRVDQATVIRMVEKYANVIEEKRVTPELLRTTYGVRVFEETKDVEHVQKMMGLSNPLSVFKYLKNEKTKLPVPKTPVVIENLLGIEKAKDIMDEYPVHIGLIPYAKGQYWEYIFFGQAMTYQYEDKLSTNRKKASFDLWEINDRKMGLEEAKEFMLSKIRVLGTILKRYSDVTNGILNKGIGEPGEEGDANYIVEAVKEFTDIYMDLIFWKMEFESIAVTFAQRSFYEYVVNQFAEKIFVSIDEWYKDIKNATVQFLDLSLGEIKKEDLNVNMSLKLNSIDMEEFSYKVQKFVNCCE